MGIDFKVFKGSETGDVVESSDHREVGPTEALIELSHCGVCGTDEHYRHADQGLGHEGVGIIKELGEHASRLSDLKIGDRVGMGWMQKFCMKCEPCLTGRQIKCQNFPNQFGTGNLDLGCFGSAIAWDVTCLFKIPDGIASEHAGPLMCGGATVWGPLYEHGIRAGERIGIVGIGGLGHLAIQFASKMGMEAVVFSTSESKRQEAMKFGAAEFHVVDPGKPFEGIKPVNHLLITSSVVPELSHYVPVLAPFAKIFPLTISFDAIAVPMLPLVLYGYQVIGSAGAHAQSMKDMLDFCAKHDVKPQIETFSMTQEGITNAMQKLRDGTMRYRGVVVA